MSMNLLYIAILLVCSYLVGSIPTGYWLVKMLKGIDIRQHGSGSTGATNVWRCVGKWPGIMVFFIDLLKGVLPVRLVMSMNITLDTPFATADQILPVLMASAALIGHGKSIFLGFQGGKSAATGLGTLLALQPLVGISTFATWLVVLALARMVSAASIVATGFCGVYMALAKASPCYVAYCVVGFIYVTYRHKANIQRILNGTEPKLKAKPKIPDNLKT